MPRKHSSSKKPASKKRATTGKRTVRARFVERYLMCFSNNHETGIIDLSNWDNSAGYNSETKTFERGRDFIFNMRDGDGDFYYIYSKKQCEEVCDIMYDQRPVWF